MSLPTSQEPNLYQPDPKNQILHICTIALDAIAIGESNLKRVGSFDPENNRQDAELLESIRVNGVVEPIMVQKMPSGVHQSDWYLLIFGYRRVAAARMNGLIEIPAIVENDRTADLSLGLAENLGQMPISHYEKAVQIENYRRMNPGETALEIGRKLGMAKTEVNNLIEAFEESTPYLRLLLHSQAVEVKAILILQPVFAKLSQEKQVELLKMLRRGISRSQAWELRNLTERNTSPIEAAALVLCNKSLSEKTENRLVGEQDSDGNQPAESSAFEPVFTSNNPKEELDQLLGPEEKARYLHILTGISTQSAADLVKRAAEMNMKLKTLAAACVAIVNGAAPHAALESAQRVMTLRGNKELTALIDKQLKIILAIRSEVANLPVDEQDFVLKVVGLQNGLGNIPAE